MPNTELQTNGWVRDRNPNSPTHGDWFAYGRRYAQIALFPLTSELSLHNSLRDIVRSKVYIPLSASILFVGAGFGFLEEVFRSIGYANCNSLDNSAVINANLISEANITVRNNFINADLLGDVSTLGTWDYLIAEHVTSTIPLIERPLFYSNLNILSPRVIHLVTARIDKYSPDGYTMQILRQWHNEQPSHLWINSGNSLGSV